MTRNSNEWERVFRVAKNFNMTQFETLREAPASESTVREKKSR